MSCGMCKVCTCSNKLNEEFNNYLGKVFNKIKHDVNYHAIADFDKDDHFLVSYNDKDKIYEVHPHYEHNDYSEVIKGMGNGSTGNVYDEHGKLISAFKVNNDKIDYEIINTKNSDIFTQIEHSISSNIKDYKLKRLISRYISIIECHGVTVAKKNEYGSTELEHLLWMLKDIYNKGKRTLLERYMFLGYIQGVLHCKNLIDVRHERDIMHELV